MDWTLIFANCLDFAERVCCGVGGEEKPERGPGVEVDVNDAKIIYFDGAVRQGVIQVIDNVLLPQSIKDEFNL